MTQDISDHSIDDADHMMDDISDYMSSPVISLDSDSTVQEAAQYMRVSNIGSLLIKDFDDFVGIVTEADLTRKVVGGGLNPETTPISQVMTQPVQSMDRFLPIEEANNYMHAKKIRHLAVSEDDKIVGMLSIKDLVSYYAKSSFKMQE